MRGQEIRKAIKRLLRVTAAPEELNDKIDRIFLQMGEIQEVRDRIAHYGARLEPQIGKGWISSDNLIGAREMMQVETFHFKVQDLIDMSDDL